MAIAQSARGRAAAALAGRLAVSPGGPPAVALGGTQLSDSLVLYSGMPSKPRTPRETVKVRRLPKVGDEITIRAKVTRVTDELVTVMIQANGQRTTAEAALLLDWDEDSGT